MARPVGNVYASHETTIEDLRQGFLAPCRVKNVAERTIAWCDRHTLGSSGEARLKAWSSPAISPVRTWTTSLCRCTKPAGRRTRRAAPRRLSSRFRDSASARSTSRVGSLRLHRDRVLHVDADQQRCHRLDDLIVGLPDSVGRLG